jgi:DNA-binding NarL/FixJ family response regulator
VEQVRVSLEAPDPVTLSGLYSYLESQNDVVILRDEDRSEADVVVVVLDLVGAAAVATLRRAAVRTGKPIVLIAGQVNEAEFLTVLDCRVAAVVPRSTATRDHVLRGVATAAGGGGLLPAQLVGALVEQVAQMSRDPAADVLKAGGLTARELRVLRLIAEGLDTEEIAVALHISERTVKGIVHDLTQRLKLRNRSHAVAYAMRSGLI